jgi:diketogulonate reductase-like aldo/keto reductase
LAPSVPTVTLHDDIAMPQIGLGVYQVPLEETAETVHHALEAGYRSIDTASLYRNERGVGDAIAASGIPREELFVTTKVWNTDQGYDQTLAAFERSLSELQLDYVDLYLIHWPAPARGLYVDTWRALLSLKAAGSVRAVGVSNFLPEHLDRLIEEEGVVPAINQVELHPRLQQPELRAAHVERGIVTEAWSPLAKGGLMDDPVIQKVAARVERTPAQVILRWHLQLGTVVIPKSSNPARIRENLDILSFELREADMDAIRTLDRGSRVGAHPSEVA